MKKNIRPNTQHGAIAPMKKKKTTPNGQHGAFAPMKKKKIRPNAHRGTVAPMKKKKIRPNAHHGAVAPIRLNSCKILLNKWEYFVKEIDLLPFNDLHFQTGGVERHDDFTPNEYGFVGEIRH
ncbi:hypothetical protein CEXT_496241 [Caerostris extrusa]|uniref:Uncharacterized protein n=1 Tax=Caerostris extrusa TaxID=172846 RepID=A0AAV4VQ33_CAEEX|nr:hypothetical protein CEXT_496241 [Caerostris extrusa]